MKALVLKININFCFLFIFHLLPIMETVLSNDYKKYLELIIIYCFKPLTPISLDHKILKLDPTCVISRLLRTLIKSSYLGSSKVPLAQLNRPWFSCRYFFPRKILINCIGFTCIQICRVHHAPIRT